MIPASLTLKGFLSYKDVITVDLSLVDVACVSGANGAGKSSLFDAMTWALFGRARRSDDALINDGSETCAVTMEFDYESNRYRVQREKPRGKGMTLEFQIKTADGGWKPLTEAGLRTTENRITDVLRLDYDTFINASFFLQGKADLFTQQQPARRKEILSSILGLEVWETYREEAALRRRSVVEEIKGLRAWQEEVIVELGQEAERKERLKLLTDNLRTTSALREEKERQFSAAQDQAHALSLETDKLALIQKGLESARTRLMAAETRIKELTSELESHEKTLANAEDIEKKYQGWQDLKKELEHWNELSLNYHRLQTQRAEVDAVIRAEGARLQQEMEGLMKAQSEIKSEETKLPELQAQLNELNTKQKDAEKRLEELPGLEQKAADAQKRDGELSAENKTLREQMLELKDRIQNLEVLEGGDCPLCGQELSDEHRKDILANYEEQGKKQAEHFRANDKDRQALAQEITALTNNINDLRKLRELASEFSRTAAGITSQVEAMITRKAQWEQVDNLRLAEIEPTLARATFSSFERNKLSEIDSQIKALGYLEESHTKVRSAETELRSIENEFLNLEKARTTVAGLRRELSSLNETGQIVQEEFNSQAMVFESMQKDLSEKKDKLPDLENVQIELDIVRRDENRLLTEVGGARQMVNVLEKQRERQKELTEKIEDLNRQVSQLKLLEIAFGKDGVPALLIEQALPEIETQANELLDRLSDGRMSVSFETEREYKDKKRDDKRQTLDILISDASGRREYELFSGGEAFRINFAIRLALSRVLAGRAGARLQTLVIDEGFGSQDAEGRQRLVEAINLVSRDFAKILVITHLDDLKDAFPSRIEVTKVNGSSMVGVVA